MKCLFATLSLLATLFNSTPLTTVEQSLDCYTMRATVVVSNTFDVVQDEWLVASQDNDGNIWEWYADDASWTAGDKVVLLLDDVRGTPSNVYDDAVTMVCYVK